MAVYTFYRITHKNYPELNYVGSTKNLRRRQSTHKYSCFNFKAQGYNKPLYQFIRSNNIDWEELNFEVLMKAECYIPLIIENMFIQQYNSINRGMNKLMAYTNQDEYEKTELRIERKKQNSKKWLAKHNK